MKERLKRAEYKELSAEQIAGLREFAAAQGMSDEELQAAIDRVKNEEEVWLNSQYQVCVRRYGDSLVHLSIKRIDKAAVRDWRDMQAIKNQLVGEECEGVELYPAESRKVDTANQYHMWCMADSGYRFPFGFGERVVDYREYGGLRQRGEGEKD